MVLALAVAGTVALGTVHANGAKPLVAGQSAGTLINDFQVRASGVDGTAYLVSYWSQTYLNQPVVVTGIVYVPSGTAPAGGWPVVTYAHGTDGMTADCGPSDDPSSGVPDVNSLLDQGWEVVATDYQGETDTDIASAVNELQPHGVSMPTAEDVIDMVRAARQIPAAHASANYVAWGFSQGGAAVTIVEAIAAAYAPELNLVGVVSTAPSAQILDNFYGNPTATVSPFTLMYVAAYNQVYGSAGAPLTLTNQGMKFYNDLYNECYDQLAQAMSGYHVDQVFNTTSLNFSFAILLASNDPIFFNVTGTAPVLLVQGVDDTTDPSLDTWALEAHMCSIGQNTLMWDYQGLGHSTIVDSSIGDVVHWIADRFAGQPNPDPYTPNWGSGSYRITCP